MSSYLLFLILGLGSGATYAILGQGLVLKYRSAGVVDFAHGAVAMFIAYVFVNLRSFGELELPAGAAPAPDLAERRRRARPALAIVISLVYAAVLGLLLYVIVYRPLQSASPLTRVCASVGVMLTLQAIAVLNYSTEPVATNPIFPSSRAVESRASRSPRTGCTSPASSSSSRSRWRWSTATPGSAWPPGRAPRTTRAPR